MAAGPQAIRAGAAAAAGQQATRAGQQAAKAGVAAESVPQAVKAGQQAARAGLVSSGSLKLAAVAVVLVLLAAIGVLLFFDFRLSSQLSALSQKQEQTSAQLSSLQADYAGLNSNYSSLQAALEEKSRQLGSANSQISALSSQLDQTSGTLAQKEQELESSQNSLAAQRQAAQQIASDLAGLQTDVNASIYWYRDNAAFPVNYSWKADIYLKRVLSDCVEGNELNLGCMSYLMGNAAFDIHYSTDLGSAGKSNFLQSVKQTIDIGLGDCKDYSLLFKAALNSIRQKQKGLQVVTFAPGGAEDFYIYPKKSMATPDQSYWYVPNARTVRLGSLDSLNAYVICYRLDEQAGHCTVALSSTPVNSSSQIGNLYGAGVFEPQNGVYLGSVGSEFSICSEDGCTAQIGAIQIAISDSDFYKFEGGKWSGYSDYLSRIGAAQAGLSQFT